MYNFNSYALSRFCDENIFFIFFGRKNVDQNLCQKHLTPFYCKIIGSGSNLHGDKYVEFEKIYQMEL